MRPPFARSARGFWLTALVALLSACDGDGNAPSQASADAAPEATTAEPSSDAGTGTIDAAPDAALEAGDATSTDASGSASDPCAEAGSPPSTLACTGLYADIASKAVSPSAVAYTPASPLWSDGAQKQRWIALPPNTQIDTSNPSEWVFPVGTKAWKEFRVDGKRVETRLFQKAKPSFWVYATYAWNADDTDALIDFGGPVSVGDSGASWVIPSNDDCNDCHRGRQDRLLGFEEVSLGLPAAQGLTLAGLVESRLLTNPPARSSLTLGDDGTGLDAVALGFLHVNCGVTCHNANPAAAGYGAGMLLRLDPTQLDGSPPSAGTWDILRTTLGVPSVSGSLVGKPRIQAGDAASSVIHQLIAERGTLQMPPIGSALVDTADVAAVAAWIDALPRADAGVTSRDAGDLDAAEDAAEDAATE